MSMHQHYHVIRQLSTLLAGRLHHAILQQAFTFSKNELSLYFQEPDGCTFSLHIQIAYSKCFLLFDNKSYLPRSNAQAVFETICGKKISTIEQHYYNRSFSLIFNGGQLVFKMYDGLANVLYYASGQQLPSEMFRDDITNDLKIELNQFHQTNPEWVQQQDSIAIEDGIFSICKSEKLPYAMQTGRVEDAEKTTTDLFEAYNLFSRYNLSALNLHARRNKLLAAIRQKIQQSEKLIQLTEIRIREINQEISPEETGHIIMANLHMIKPGMTEVALDDFYRNKPLIIKLKKDLTPQANAAYYYRKAKNRQEELRQLEEKIASANQKLKQLQAEMEDVASATQLRELKNKEKTQPKELFPFRVFHKNGFEIWVGKSAANNDVLTLKYAHKNDMWLHAKDVAGSHVVIRHQAGKPFPKEVLEYAGCIAAYYSKLKGSNLVPVAYTIKKFVRKPKGFLPGQVAVDKEEVMLVKPELK